MIGNAREEGGLYYFDEIATENNKVVVSRCNSTSTSADLEKMLWHRRLGHPSFSYLQKLLLVLFRKKKFIFISM